MALLCVLSRTLSIMCITPFHRMMSGVEMCAVEFPLFTNVPVELTLAVMFSPPALMKLDFEVIELKRSDVYTVEPFMIYVR